MSDRSNDQSFADALTLETASNVIEIFIEKGLVDYNNELQLLSFGDDELGTKKRAIDEFITHLHSLSIFV